MRSNLRPTRVASFSAALGLGIAVAALATPATAQEVPQLKLKPANATHPEEFTNATSVRELSDGRVIATDGGEQRLLVLDFETGEATQFGRKGRGPQEYSMLVDIHATGADSSIMTDISGRRWLLFDGAQIVETVPPDNAAVTAVESVIHGADAMGHVMQRQSPPSADNGVTVTGIEDSSAIVLVERSTGHVDTVAKVRSRPRRVESRTNAEGKVTFRSFSAIGVLTSEEAAVLFTDGTIGVARLEPFRVDWRSPTGTWTRGAPLNVPRIRVDDRERRAYFERNAGAWDTSRLPPGFPAPKRPSDDDFPEFFPAFPSNAVSAGPAGTLIVRRSKSADYMTPHYFVIDRSGRLLGEIALPENEEIVGAGEHTLYVGFKDENDIQRIRRHPWP